MSIGKNGVWKENNFSNFSYRTIITPQVIQEPDGSTWLQVLHHNNPTSNLFSSTDTFSLGVYKNSDMWAQFNIFNVCSKWEILLKQKDTETSTEMKFRWVQSVNPNIATFDQTKAANVTKNTSAGYTTNTYGGLYYNNGSNAYLVGNNGNNGNWYGALGCWKAFQGGIPSFNNTVITTGYTNVYVRIDNDSLSVTDKMKIFNNQNIIANNFTEI